MINILPIELCAQEVYWRIFGKITSESLLCLNHKQLKECHLILLKRTWKNITINLQEAPLDILLYKCIMKCELLFGTSFSSLEINPILLCNIIQNNLYMHYLGSENYLTLLPCIDASQDRKLEYFCHLKRQLRVQTWMYSIISSWTTYFQKLQVDN